MIWYFKDVETHGWKQCMNRLSKGNDFSEWLKWCWRAVDLICIRWFEICSWHAAGKGKRVDFVIFFGGLNVCRSAWFLHVVLGQPNQQVGWHVAEHERTNYRCYHLSSGEASYQCFFWYGQTCSASGLSAHLLPYRWPVETECAWASKGSEGMCSSTCLRVQSPKSWFWLGSYQDISRLLFDEPFHAIPMLSLHRVLCFKLLWPWLGMNWPSEISLGHADTEHC